MLQPGSFKENAGCWKSTFLEHRPLDSAGGQVLPAKAAKLLLPVSLSFAKKRLCVKAYVDCGAAGNLMDFLFAKSLGVPLLKLKVPIQTITINGTSIDQGGVEFITDEISMSVGTLHNEQMSFFVIHNLSDPVVLGMPWLHQHNPVIDWRIGDIVRWSPRCQNHCMSLSVNQVKIKNPSIPYAFGDYEDVFSIVESEKLPPHREYDCPIDLVPGARLPKGRIFNLSGPERVAMNDYIADSLRKGFIRPSTSPVGAGFFFVEKKDGGLRPCIDYRELNAITVKNQYSLPLIPDLFNQLLGARWFTKLDLRGAYNLVRIRSGDEWKTAFNTPLGHFEYLVMPFGLSNAPAVFQHFVNDIFRDICGVYVVVYLDDILIYSADPVTHAQHVRSVLQRLRKNSLYAKLEKCVFFFLEEVQFLGYMVSGKGFRMDPAKIQPIKDWVQPKSLKALQRFLGFANYYRKFIRGFSEIAKPLTDLTRKGADDNDFINKWETLTNTCSRGFMELLKQMNQDSLVSLETEMEALQVILRRDMTSDLLKKFNEEMDDLSQKWAQEIQSTKAKKFQRDVEDKKSAPIKDLHLFSRKLLLRKLHAKRTSREMVSEVEREALRNLEELLDEQTAPSTRTSRFPTSILPKSAKFPPLSLCPAIEIFTKLVYEDFKELSTKLRYDNLTHAQRIAMRELQKLTDVVFKPADKGGNIVVWPHDKYEREAFRQLRDPNTYTRLSFNPLATFSLDLQRILLEALDNSVISRQVFDGLVTKHPRIPTFYLLPKVHKNALDPPGISFLDIAMSVDHSGYIQTDVYRKPTSVNSLVHASSAHNPSTIGAVPVGLFLRARRICSSDTKFEIQSADLKMRFLNRGYSNRSIKKGYLRARATPRGSLLESSKRPSCSNKEGPIRFISTFNHQWEDMRQILMKHWSILGYPEL
ncbi:LOW QUALITY PROTEIN: uncharacterized protein [Dendrobates tinctorius]|uniref:LOW QUALITY PROTEIN: uncharacterized protein n=1 Tax=Dendrobates tinctorius TaxID=92724 RepID=UPI003CC97EFF